MSFQGRVKIDDDVRSGEINFINAKYNIPYFATILEVIDLYKYLEQ